MNCPFCGSDGTQVKDSRPAAEGGAVRRRRICVDCNSRFTTYERIHLRDLTVIKSDGSRQPFSREKILTSMRVALRKRDYDPELLERLVNAVASQLEISNDSDIPTAKIGGMVMEHLWQMDKVAYIRYASVYRDFREASDFSYLADRLQQSSGRAAE